METNSNQSSFKYEERNFLQKFKILTPVKLHNKMKNDITVKIFKKTVTFSLIHHIIISITLFGNKLPKLNFRNNLTYNSSFQEFMNDVYTIR